MYATGNAWAMNLTLFQEAHDSVDGDVVSMDDMARHAARRFDDSVATNPWFYYGPYTGMISRNAGYIFGGRLLCNHSNEFPDGQLSEFCFSDPGPTSGTFILGA